MGFGDRVISAIEGKGAPICVGLDPREELIPPECMLQARDAGLSGRSAQARGFSVFCKQVIDQVAEHAAAVKPQAAFFEVLGSVGMAAFETVCRHARRRGLLVIADVKRGDIGSTAAAYARAYLGAHENDSPLADACTVNPYMGSDGIVPFIDEGAKRGGGIFVLVKTSNPSSSELQDLKLGEGRVYEQAARLVERLNVAHLGESGYGSVGAVVGATWPEVLKTLRKTLAGSILLLPGYGAQGAGAEDVVSAFDANGRGALVTASRSITFPWASERSCPRDWRSRIEEAVTTMRLDLQRVIGGGC